MTVYEKNTLDTLLDEDMIVFTELVVIVLKCRLSIYLQFVKTVVDELSSLSSMTRRFVIYFYPPQVTTDRWLLFSGALHCHYAMVLPHLFSPFYGNLGAVERLFFYFHLDELLRTRLQFYCCSAVTANLGGQPCRFSY